MNRSSFFSGAYGGDTANLRATDRLECRICWQVYDPAAGDPDRQIPAGTPFAELPESWTCPTCDAAQGEFLLIRDEAR